MIIVENIFTTLGLIRLATGAKLVDALTSLFSGLSSTSSFGGGLVLALTSAVDSRPAKIAVVARPMVLSVKEEARRPVPFSRFAINKLQRPARGTGLAFLNQHSH